MTRAEAIEILEDGDLYELWQDYPEQTPYMVKKDKAKQALELAIEALKKQVPMKPIRVLISKNGSTTDGCPMCQYPFTMPDRYCRDCGQAIDWSVDT